MMLLHELAKGATTRSRFGTVLSRHVAACVKQISHPTRWRSKQVIPVMSSIRCSSAAQHTAGGRIPFRAAAMSQADAGDGKAKPEDFLGPPVIIGPADGCKAEDPTSALLVLAPGALIPAADYRQLAEALQTALNGRVCVTVAILDIDWSALGFPPLVITTELLEVGVEKAVDAAAAHIEVQQSRNRRYENVFVAGHSLIGVAAVRFALERAAGLVLMGSAMLPATSDLYPTARTWTNPILQLSAELDGQQYLSKQAFSVLTAAETAAKLGLRHAATFQPALVMPGLNHASFASGQEKQLFPGAPPLNLQPDVDHGKALQQIAEVLADFLVVHRSKTPDHQISAADALLARQIKSARLVDPFLTALGRGSPEKALMKLLRKPNTPNPQAALFADIIPGSFGGEVLRDDEQSRGWLAHPGELAAAEAFAAEVQLSAVPHNLHDRVLVAATAHTDEATFLYNQPTIERRPDGKVLVHVHVHLWRHALETRERIQPAVAPEYAIKLRTVSAICRALGLHTEAEQQTSSRISGRDTNAATFQKALSMVTLEVRERYQRRGKQFSFGDDVSDAASPKDWVQQQRVRFRDTSERETQITSPTVNTQKDGEPVPKMESYSRGAGRFVGNHYIKVVSLARAVEWLMTDTLRPAKLQ